MTSQDAATRAKELAVTCDHTWGEVRGKGACAACIVRFVNAAVAEAVKEQVDIRRNALAKMAEDLAADLEYSVAAARREEREQLAAQDELIDTLKQRLYEITGEPQ